MIRQLFVVLVDLVAGVFDTALDVAFGDDDE